MLRPLSREEMKLCKLIGKPFEDDHQEAVGCACSHCKPMRTNFSGLGDQRCCVCRRKAAGFQIVGSEALKDAAFFVETCEEHRADTATIANLIKRRFLTR